MKIIFASKSSENAKAWVKSLQQAMPEAEVVFWNNGSSIIGAEIAVVWDPPKQLLKQETKLRALFNLGAGVDALLKLPDLRSGVSIYRLEDAGMSAQMAEYVIYALVKASRGFGVYEQYQARSYWSRLPNIKRSQWAVGVMGMGLMGSSVAQAIAALDYPVAGWSTGPKSIDGVQSFWGEDQFDAFLKRTRVLVNVLPLTDNTKHILCRKNMSKLLPDSHVINIGRGDHLNENDLLEMLDEGHISGATLDVFKQEPLPAEHPFWQHSKITVTPHIAAATLIDETVAQLTSKIRAFLQNKPVSGLVHHHRGY